jgi:hypothetical protein
MQSETEPQKARILLDFDGTMARVNDFACAVMTALGFPLTTRDLRTYDSVRQTPEMERAFWTAYDILDAMPNVRAALEPYDENTGPALEILAASHMVDVVTANEPVAECGIRAWLNKNAPNAFALVRCLGRHSPSKATLGYDIIIDDSPNLANECQIIRRWRTWPEVVGLVQHAAESIQAGRARGPILLLANARWNESVEDKGEL